jgi:hypothetical protein
MVIFATILEKQRQKTLDDDDRAAEGKFSKPGFTPLSFSARELEQRHKIGKRARNAQTNRKIITGLIVNCTHSAEQIRR